jgi:hypothetical protein
MLRYTHSAPREAARTFLKPASSKQIGYLDIRAELSRAVMRTRAGKHSVLRIELRKEKRSRISICHTLGRICSTELGKLTTGSERREASRTLCVCSCDRDRSHKNFRRTLKYLLCTHVDRCALVKNVMVAFMVHGCTAKREEDSL